MLVVMPVILTLLFRIQLDQGINPHHSNTRLDRTLQLPDLAHARLQDPSLDLIHTLSPC